MSNLETLLTASANKHYTKAFSSLSDILAVKINTKLEETRTELRDKIFNDK